MARAEPARSPPNHPEFIKSLRDTQKAGNWGYLNSRPVLIDYGEH